MTFYVKQGSWKPVKEVYVKQSGSWKPVKQMFVKTNGVWKPVFSAESDLKWIKLQPKSSSIRVHGAVVTNRYFVIFYSSPTGYQDWEQPNILLFDANNKQWFEWRLTTFTTYVGPFTVASTYDSEHYSFAFGQLKSGYDDSWYCLKGTLSLTSSSTFIKDKKVTYDVYGVDKGFTNIVGNNARVYAVDPLGSTARFYASGDVSTWAYYDSPNWRVLRVSQSVITINNGKYYWSERTSSSFTVYYANDQTLSGKKYVFNNPLGSTIDDMHLQGAATLGNNLMPVYTRISGREGEFVCFDASNQKLYIVSETAINNLLGFNEAVGSYEIFGASSANKALYGEYGQYFKISLSFSPYIYRYRGNIANCVSSTYNQNAAVLTDINNLYLIWWKSTSATCNGISINPNTFNKNVVAKSPSSQSDIQLQASKTFTNYDNNYHNTVTKTGSQVSSPSDFNIVASCS